MITILGSKANGATEVLNDYETGTRTVLAFRRRRDGMSFADSVATARSLEDVLQAIRGYRNSETLEDEQLLSSLPNFGGEPMDCIEVWSWDENRLLVGTGSDDMRIMTRAEFARSQIEQQLEQHGGY